MGRPRLPFVERFNEYWEPITETGCWIWTGKGERYGHMRTGYVNDGNRKTQAAHRISWEIHVGEIPEGLRVLHKCDTPSCVNPAHLFIGTDRDNMDDMLAKGRSARGEANCKAKLLPADVIYIRESSKSAIELSKIYLVTPTTIHDVRIRKTWKHL